MATNTYVALDKVTISGTSTSIVTFSSIPSTYTDLIIVGNLGSESTNAFPYLQFNVDTNSNYSFTQTYGNGTSAYSSKVPNTTQLFNSDCSVKQGAVNSNVIYQIMNYSNTTTYKTSLARQNTVDAADYSHPLSAVGLWRNTAAINRVDVKLTRGGTAYNFSNGSTFSLYGIRAESTSPAPKARGGAIYSDSTYYYHAFGSTGTFTPLQSLTADILVVAGGGQGGGGNGGGGGAGGLRYFASESLTAVAYTCTIGAGGSGGLTNAAGGNGVNSQFGSLTLSTGGGGGGGYSAGAATSGGSGGGAGTAGNTTPGSASPSGQGNAGGNSHATDNLSGGGGGSGAVGGNGTTTTSGAGGNGTSSYSSWGFATGVGQNVAGTYYIAGGGSGGGDAASNNAIIGPAGYGGGGLGGSEVTNASAGTVNTGGGGGGEGGGGAGANGGSGVIIVRYAKV